MKMWLKDLEFCFGDKQEDGQIKCCSPYAVLLYSAYKECITL